MVASRTQDLGLHVFAHRSMSWRLFLLRGFIMNASGLGVVTTSQLSGSLTGYNNQQGLLCILYRICTLCSCLKCLQLPHSLLRMRTLLGRFKSDRTVWMPSSTPVSPVGWLHRTAALPLVSTLPLTCLVAPPPMVKVTKKRSLLR